MADEQNAIPSGNLQFSHLVAGLVVLVVVALTGWAYFQRYNLNNQISEVAGEIIQVEAELESLTEKQLDSVIIAQQTVDDLETSAIQWSEAVTNLLSVTPLDIFYRSYTASSNGKMSVSVLTDSYDSAANLISVLEGSDDFSEVFVSSLTQASDESGAGVVSFGVTFNVQ
ncbi:MAG: hypothetical protein Q8P27_00535 [Candidatus Peregrinibacteria bacterium]|nr:hypothetical protein [Candidatus Peregrinibacteria bacterium]